jgi:hypothetical protein
MGSRSSAFCPTFWECAKVATFRVAGFGRERYPPTLDPVKPLISTVALIACGSPVRDQYHCHEFRPLAAKEVRELLDRRWAPPGVCLPQQPLDAETVAAIIRITGGNFRLLNRLLTQMERILEINALQQVTKTVVEAARESLVIGQA